MGAERGRDGVELELVAQPRAERGTIEIARQRRLPGLAPLGLRAMHQGLQRVIHGFIQASHGHQDLVAQLDQLTLQRIREGHRDIARLHGGRTQQAERRLARIGPLPADAQHGDLSLLCAGREQAHEAGTRGLQRHGHQHG